jgi:hypothetical protein
LRALIDESINTGLKIEPDEKKNLNNRIHRRFPNLNYTIKPHPV